MHLKYIFNLLSGWLVEALEERRNEGEVRKGRVCADETMAIDMSANRWKYFRWTPRTAWITFAYVVVVPSALCYVGLVTEVSCLCSSRWTELRGSVGGGAEVREVGGWTPKTIGVREWITLGRSLTFSVADRASTS